MNTQITALTEPDTGTVPRNSYMAALSLAETILSESTVIPSSFVIEVMEHAPTEPTIRFYFHRDPAAVAEFADERWMKVTSETYDDGSVYTATQGRIRGVQVTAWALMPVEVLAAVADEVAA